jgi:hypothetical protein
LELPSDFHIIGQELFSDCTHLSSLKIGYSNLRWRYNDLPEIVVNTIIDWFVLWPKEALSAIDSYFVK